MLQLLVMAIAHGILEWMSNVGPYCPDFLMTGWPDPPALVMMLIILLDLVSIALGLTLIVGLNFFRNKAARLLRPSAIVSTLPILGWNLAGMLYWRDQTCNGEVVVRGLFIWRDQTTGVVLSLLGCAALITGAFLSRRRLRTALVSAGALGILLAEWVPGPTNDFTSPSILPGAAAVLIAIAFIIDARRHASQAQETAPQAL